MVGVLPAHVAVAEGRHVQVARHLLCRERAVDAAGRPILDNVGRLAVGSVLALAPERRREGEERAQAGSLLGERDDVGRRRARRRVGGKISRPGRVKDGLRIAE